jgi:hypothetical protein
MKMLGRQLWICKVHRDNSGGGRHCLSCDAAMVWNLSNQFCSCGAKATGYVARGLDLPVEFYCDPHFDAAKETLYAATAFTGS